MTWDRVTIIGCGLIGASFALALRRSGGCDHIAGWDTDSSALDAAMERGIIDEVDDALARGSVSSSSLVYLAMPVENIKRFLQNHAAQVRSGAIITDAGSTKREVCQAAREYLPSGRWFVGGHPIAGSHLTGSRHASHTLFEGAAYVLTTDNAEAYSRPVSLLRETLERLGARVVLMEASEHDRAMALVSHLPQLLSSALAATVREQPAADLLVELSGSGYRDMTRLSASSWAIWQDILRTNASMIADSLDALTTKLQSVRDELRQCAERTDVELSAAKSLFKDNAVTTG